MHSPNKSLRVYSLVCLLSLLMLGGCQSLSKTDISATQQTPAAGDSQTAEKTPAQLLKEQAEAAVSDGDIDSAIIHYQKLLETQPEDANNWTRIGLLYLHRKRLDEAGNAFKKAISLNDQDAVAHNHLGVVFREKGEFKQALFHYYRAIKYQADYANAHLNLGILLDIYMNDPEQALDEYKTYQQLSGSEDPDVAKWIVDIENRIKR